MVYRCRAGIRNKKDLAATAVTIDANDRAHVQSCQPNFEECVKAFACMSFLVDWLKSCKRKTQRVEWLPFFLSLTRVCNLLDPSPAAVDRATLNRSTRWEEGVHHVAGFVGGSLRGGPWARSSWATPTTSTSSHLREAGCARKRVSKVDEKK